MTDYPKPATPLPWKDSNDIGLDDEPYVVYAANAISHLVAALKSAAQALDEAEVVIDADVDEETFHSVQSAHRRVKRALAIARGEMKP